MKTLLYGRNFLWMVALFSTVASGQIATVRGSNADKAATLEDLFQSFETDTRVPYFFNLSGVWSTGSGFSGYELRLEHNGEKVSGRGYGWGCVGEIVPFDVKGEFRKGALTLTVAHPGRGPEYWHFEFVPTPSGITLKRHGDTFPTVFYTANDVRRMKK